MIDITFEPIIWSIAFNNLRDHQFIAPAYQALFMRAYTLKADNFLQACRNYLENDGHQSDPLQATYLRSLLNR